MKLFNLTFILLFGLSLGAQTLDEELGFIYVKADYLLETNRYDEAIAEFTKIIDKDATFRDALYKRADAKFNVGAFKGTHNDLLRMFEVKGITPESVLLYGKAAKNLGNTDVADVTMETAGMLYPDGTSPRTKSRSTKEREGTSDDSAEDKIKDEVKKIEDKISSILDDLLPKDEDEAAEGGNSSDDGGSSREDSSDRDTTDKSEDSSGTRTSADRKRDTSRDEVEEEEESEPKVDNSVKEIYIDEDVSLEIKNGLGARKILNQPSILILNETSGSVVIDLCVNSNGKVTQAEYNKSESTLTTQSIISLAVRKTKEFWFKSSSADEMCGTIVFKITGS